MSSGAARPLGDDGIDEDGASSSFFMPAEWSPHLACIILYPHNPCTFPQLCKAQEQVRQVAQAIADHGEEDVVLFCVNEQAAQELLLQELLPSSSSKSHTKSKIHVLVCPSNDTWARDTAATFLISSSSPPQQQQSPTRNNQSSSLMLLALNWQFNAYGGPTQGAYWPCDVDQHIATRTCQQLASLYNRSISIAVHDVSLILEGGSIHTDGQGTVLTTDECLLHPNRNPTKSKQEIEHMILTAVGGTKMIWLPHGLAFDDDTNGHIDNMACFASPTQVVLSWCDEIEDGVDDDLDNYRRCRAAYHVLRHETDAQGRSLTIHKLHVPKPMNYTQEDLKDTTATATCKDLNDDHDPLFHRSVGQRLAASYVNFYIANRAVIVPQFEGCDDTNQRALDTLQHAFPDRKVVGVSSREILLGGGNIHCITQQIPKP